MSTVESWRGVAHEERGDEITARAAGILRLRSRTLLASLLRPHGGKLAVSTFLVLATTAAGLAGPALVGAAIDRGIRPMLTDGAGSGTLVLLVAALVFVSLAEAATHGAFLRVSGRIGQGVLFDLRRRLFDHFQRLSIGFYERYTSGRAIARLTSDVDTLTELLNTGLVSVVTAVLSIVGIGVILVSLDVALSLATLSVFPLIVLVTIWFRKHSVRAYRASRRAVALLIVHFVESLGGIRAVQAFRREPRNQEIFEELNTGYGDANFWTMSLSAKFGPGISFLGRATTAIVLLYGGYRALDGHVTVGTLTAFILYLRRFFEPMQELSQFYNVFQAASAALENLSGVLDEEPGVPEPIVPKRPDPLRGEVVYDRVTFKYRSEQEPILSDFSLRIEAGQTVALVGETGAGKSTIARLMARFYDPVDGRVLLDGVSLRDIPDADLRRMVAMVTQEQFMFSGTVADNILFGRPEATREELIEATKAIGAHDFIAALPDGYDTDVRTRGLRLSSGQRQLVAFARAFLADPQVLILDEATSSLDIPSERLVQRALRTLLADRTAVIIAHRLSTVEIADRVLVLEHGSVVEDGTPAELLEAGGHYRDLHQAWLDSLV